MKKKDKNKSSGIFDGLKYKNKSSRICDSLKYKNKSSRICDSLKGSYTIEAATVISLVFLVLGSLLICSFYIHDKGVLQGIVCEISAVGSNFSTEKEQKAAVNAIERNISKSRFLGSKNVKGSISVGKKEITATWRTIFPVPGFAMKYLANSKIEIEKEWKSRKLDPAKTIRLIRGAEKLFQIEEG